MAPLLGNLDTSLPPDLAKLRDEIAGYARGYGLDFFDVSFEMVDSDTMNALAARSGFPVRYPHWRFGMDYDQFSKGYTWGLQKIYEMVINTDPSYAYLMKSNSTTDQKTVMAHVYAHVDFFKNNTWFSKTNRKMLDSMANNSIRIRDHMDHYGVDRVEAFIDRCLAIENLIDPYLPFSSPKKRDAEVPQNPAENTGRLKANRPYMEQYINPPEFLEEQKKKREEEAKKQRRNPAEPQKDVLAFLLENAPMEQWQYDVLSVIRDESYYFVPQMQTKIMNEGWASYWHSKIMTEKAAKDSEILDFAHAHAGTMAMSPGRMNPYKIGLEIYRDIEERWNKGRFGKEWMDCDDMIAKAKWDRKTNRGREKIFEVRRVCNDVTFIEEYLTDDLCEQLKLYTYQFNRRTNQYEIVDRDFKKVREKMLFQLTNAGSPFIYVMDGNYQNKGELYLWHKFQGIELDFRWAKETLRAVAEIWRRPVNLETEVDGQKKLLTCIDGECTEKFL